MGKLKLTVKQVAIIMGKTEQFVRIGLQRRLLPFGTAMVLDINRHSSRPRYTYYISPGQFAEYQRITMDELERRVKAIK